MSIVLGLVRLFAALARSCLLPLCGRFPARSSKMTTKKAQRPLKRPLFLNRPFCCLWRMFLFFFLYSAMSTRPRQQWSKPLAAQHSGCDSSTRLGQSSRIGSRISAIQRSTMELPCSPIQGLLCQSAHCSEPRARGPEMPKIQRPRPLVRFSEHTRRRLRQQAQPIEQPFAFRCPAGGPPQQAGQSRLFCFTFFLFSLSSLLFSLYLRTEFRAYPVTWDLICAASRCLKRFWRLSLLFCLCFLCFFPVYFLLFLSWCPVFPTLSFFCLSLKIVFPFPCKVQPSLEMQS